MTVDVHEIVERKLLPDPAVRKALRLSAGLTLQDVADVMGVDRSAVWRWESGLRKPRTLNRERYKAVLDRLREEIRG